MVGVHLRESVASVHRKSGMPKGERALWVGGMGRRGWDSTVASKAYPR